MRHHENHGNQVVTPNLIWQGTWRLCWKLQACCPLKLLDVSESAKDSPPSVSRSQLIRMMQKQHLNPKQIPRKEEMNKEKTGRKGKGKDQLLLYKLLWTQFLPSTKRPWHHQSCSWGEEVHGRLSQTDCAHRIPRTNINAFLSISWRTSSNNLHFAPHVPSQCLPRPSQHH